MNSKHLIFIFISSLVLGCGPKPNGDSSQSNQNQIEDQPNKTDVDQVIIAHSSKGEKNQPLVATILNRVVGGAEGAFIGHQMDQMANQLKNKFPKANISRIGEGVLMKLDQDSDFRFQDDQISLTNQQKNQLKKLSQLLKIHQQTKVYFVNHTHAFSSLDKNRQIAKKRVKQIAMQLKSMKLDSNRLIFDWQAHEQASSDSNSDQRLEIGIIAGKKMLNQARESISDK